MLTRVAIFALVVAATATRDFHSFARFRQNRDHIAYKYEVCDLICDGSNGTTRGPTTTTLMTSSTNGGGVTSPTTTKTTSGSVVTTSKAPTTTPTQGSTTTKAPTTPPTKPSSTTTPTTTSRSSTTTRSTTTSVTTPSTTRSSSITSTTSGSSITTPPTTTSGSSGSSSTTPSSSTSGSSITTSSSTTNDSSTTTPSTTTSGSSITPSSSTSGSSVTQPSTTINGSGLITPSTTPSHTTGTTTEGNQCAAVSVTVDITTNSRVSFLYSIALQIGGEASRNLTASITEALSLCGAPSNSLVANLRIVLGINSGNLLEASNNLVIQIAALTDAHTIGISNNLEAVLKGNVNTQNTLRVLLSASVNFDVKVSARGYAAVFVAAALSYRRTLTGEKVLEIQRVFVSNKLFIQLLIVFFKASDQQTGQNGCLGIYYGVFDGSIATWIIPVSPGGARSRDFGSSAKSHEKSNKQQEKSKSYEKPRRSRVKVQHEAKKHEAKKHQQKADKHHQKQLQKNSKHHEKSRANSNKKHERAHELKSH